MRPLLAAFPVQTAGSGHGSTTPKILKRPIIKMATPSQSAVANPAHHSPLRPTTNHSNASPPNYSLAYPISKDTTIQKPLKRPTHRPVTAAPKTHGYVHPTTRRISLPTAPLARIGTAFPTSHGYLNPVTHGNLPTTIQGNAPPCRNLRGQFQPTMTVVDTENVVYLFGIH